MKNNKINYLRPVQFLLSSVLLASTTQNAIGGTLLQDINGFLAGNYPVATAYLDLYDSSGEFIDRQQMDATGLLAAGFLNTGSDVYFYGSLTFPDLYPLVAGDSGGLLASVHDFSINLTTSNNSAYTDLVSMQIDWSGSNQNQLISQTWGSVIADDFVNGIAYYQYDSVAGPEALSYGSASFGLEFATGIAPVPLPATAWLFGSGLIGLIGFARRKANS